MGFFDDDFLLGMFDFNGDKKLDFGERLMRDAFLFDQFQKSEDKSESSGGDFFSFDSDDYDVFSPRQRMLDAGYDEFELDNMNFDLMSEFEQEALADKVKFGLIDDINSPRQRMLNAGYDEFELDKMNFDFLGGVEQEELALRAELGILNKNDDDNELCDTSVIPVTLKLTVDYPDKEESETINQCDYPNKRSYDAALHLYIVTNDTVGIYTEEQRAFETEKCEFILNSDTLAAKYLTYDNGFIFAQAVKDNFELPVDVPDEDNNRITFFDDLLTDIAEEDVVLAADIWVWCVKVFGPYLKYTDYDSEITNGILFNLDSYPQEFTDILVEKLDTDDEFCRLLLTDTNDLAYCASSLVAKALGDRNTETAKKIFSACTANPSLKSKMLESFVTELIRDCADWNDCEAMGLLSIHILPMMKEIDDKRHRRLLSKYEEEIYSYIDMMESDSEVCKYSKKYAWRNTCADGSEYGVSPKNFRTEEDYNRRLDAKKAARENQPNVDPKAESDKTVYSFCTVMFEHSQRQYIYLTGDNDIKIGDEVIVPVGEDNREVSATVVSTSQHMRLTAPYPVDKAKKILRKA